MHMNRKSVYDYFIGLLALMLSLIIVIDIFVSIPQEVRLSFYYIENIINFVLKYRIIQKEYTVFFSVQFKNRRRIWRREQSYQ